MSTSTGLDFSNVVSVGVSVAASGAQAQNTNSLLVLTNNTVIDTTTRMMGFDDDTDVGTAFGTAGPEFAAAQLWFGQTPQPLPGSFSVGLWVETAAPGTLQCAEQLTPATTLAALVAIANGGFGISVNGGAAVSVSPINFTGALTLPGAAALISAALAAHAVPATCSWNSYNNNFVFTSSTTGAASSVAFLTASATVGDTEIGVILGGLVTSSGAFVSAGQDAETALAAAQLFDQNFGNAWYSMQIPQSVDADQAAVASFLETTETRHFYWITTQHAGTLVASYNTDLASTLFGLQLTKTAIQYSSTNAYASASMAARILTTDYTANSSVITLFGKQEPLVAPEVLNIGQAKALAGKNCNAFVTYKGGALLVQPGTTCKTNYFIDTAIGLDSLAIDIQLAIFNLIYTSETKVPQDDGGMQQIVGVATQVLDQYVADGLLAPGVWNAAGFGSLKYGQTLDTGYYVYCPLVSSQLESIREQRMAVPLQIAVKLKGAIQNVPATILVNP